MRQMFLTLGLAIGMSACTGTTTVINAGYTPAQWIAFVTAVWAGVSCPVTVTKATLTVADAQSVVTASEMQSLYGANFADTVELTPAVINQVAKALNANCP